MYFQSIANPKPDDGFAPAHIGIPQVTLLLLAKQGLSMLTISSLVAICLALLHVAAQISRNVPCSSEMKHLENTYIL